MKNFSVIRTHLFSIPSTFALVRHGKFLMMMLFGKDLSTGKTKDMDLS